MNDHQPFIRSELPFVPHPCAVSKIPADSGFRWEDFRFFSLSAQELSERKRFKKQKVEAFNLMIKSESQVKSAGDFKLSGF